MQNARCQNIYTAGIKKDLFGNPAIIIPKDFRPVALRPQLLHAFAVIGESINNLLTFPKICVNIIDRLIKEHNE